jgi:hypothetical protein
MVIVREVSRALQGRTSRPESDKQHVIECIRRENGASVHTMAVREVDLQPDEPE